MMCDCKITVRLSSIDKRQCPDCKNLHEWTVKPGKVRTLSSSRDRDVISKKIS